MTATRRRDADPKPPSERTNGVLLAPASLQGAYGPHSTLTLEQIRPGGETQWRVTVPLRPGPAGGEPAAAAAAAPAAAAGPMLLTSTVTLAVRPEAYFTIAAMLLCGARLEIRAEDQTAATEILARAADSAPAELPLPDGRRMRPSAEDLDRLRRLLPQAPAAKSATWIEAWLDDPPWALQPEPAARGTGRPAGADDYLVIPSAGHYAALQQALALNRFEPTDGSRFPRARLEKGGARGYAELRPVTPEQEMLMAPEEAQALALRMWRQREDLSDLDADVLDAISAAWLESGPRSASERVPIYVDDLLRSRGLRPKKSGHGRRGGYEPEQRTDLWRCLLHLQDIWLDIAEATVVDQDARGRRTQRTRALQSRAFVMTDRIGQRRLDGTMDVEAILVTPGEAFGRFLLGPGRQLALLSSGALRYDPYRQRHEKRLARYLSWQWRVGAHSGDFIRTYRVSTLLHELGLQVDGEHPVRTRERFEKALDCLHQDRMISSWQYGERWREDLPRENWVPLWLEARIVVEAPDVIKEAYHELDRLNQSRKAAALPAGETWAARLKRHREQLGLSQMAAAEQIGISRAYLAQVERGREPAPGLAAKLRRWLEGG